MEPPFKLTVSLLSAAHAGTLVRAFKLPAAAASASARLPKYTLPRRSLCIMIVQFRLARQSVAGIGRAKPYTEQPASELAAKPEPEIEEGERTLRVWPRLAQRRLHPQWGPSPWGRRIPIQIRHA
jgi:hypothetical protein